MLLRLAQLDVLGQRRRGKARHRCFARQMALHVRQHSQAAPPPKRQAANTGSNTPHSALFRMLLVLCTHVHHLFTPQHRAQMYNRPNELRGCPPAALHHTPQC